MGKLIVSVSLLTFTVFTLGASAQSLKTRKEQQGQEEMLRSEVAYTNQVCDSTISAQMDWESFAGAKLGGSENPTASCDAALSALESLCTNEASKQAIRQKVNQVICSKGADREISLKQGTLSFQMDGPDMNDFQFIRDFLTDEVSEDE